MSSSDSQDRGRLRTDSATATDAESLLGARRAEKSIEANETPQENEEPQENIAEHDDMLGEEPDTVESATEEPSEQADTAEENQAQTLSRKDRVEVSEDSLPDSQETVAANELAEARAKAMEDKPRLLKLRAAIIALAVPLAIFGLAARLVSSTAFLWLEYHRPGFPADSYGFSTDDRMLYGSYGVNYILNFAPSTYLSELRVSPKTKLFLQTEVDHMTDVKHVMIAGMILAIVVVLAALMSSKSLTHRSPGTIRKSLFTGSILTLVLMIALGVLAGLGWDSFFTNFHHVLFPQGNWEFRMSDSLIRLYPPQFWVDAGIAFAVLAVVLIILMLAATWPGKNRRARAKLLRDFRDEQRKILQGK